MMGCTPVASDFPYDPAAQTGEDVSHFGVVLKGLRYPASFYISIKFKSHLSAGSCCPQALTSVEGIV